MTHSETVATLQARHGPHYRWLLLALGFALIVTVGLPSLNLGSMRGLPKHMLEWRLAVHGQSLTHPSTNPQRLLAFNKSFLMLAGICALAIVAAWQLREKK